ncbi:hypothetical protein BCR34DRAFT_490116 [Clohesyomyces aquaticus]|uniref:Zn(2)-C6 fungal-type domain-containing protein n=1 Tax=Clohesyomyces aquaticus TaxID=1231657 RepID=A0A1Y1Z8C4_9PLEO|nr:hypothetical protein BCR34DRAFT_490116 [Clohesyomyces aquaticus]
MGTRKTHNKTRLGCAQCKKRRIKCDIQRPTCENCSKKELLCSFETLFPSSRLSVSTPKLHTSPPRTPASVSPTQLTTRKKQPFKVLVFRNESPQSIGLEERTEDVVSTVFHIPPELRFNDAWKDCRSLLPTTFQTLLDHYEFATFSSLACNDPAKAAWQSFIPELATTHHFLVHSVLAIASLHLAHLHENTTDKRDQMVKIAAFQMNKSIPNYSAHLENLNADNAAALFACSTLTAVYIFRTTALEFEETRASIPEHATVLPGKIVDRMILAMVRTFHGLRGTYAILRPGWAWITEGRMAPVCTRPWWPRTRTPATERAVEEDRRLCELEKLWTQPGRGCEDHFMYLTIALNMLRQTFGLVSQLSMPVSLYTPVTAIPYAADDENVGLLMDRGSVFIWPTILPREFITLVEQKNREALVLVAHYAVLHGRIRNIWWLEGLGQNMIIAVAMALGRENWDLIAWPAKCAGVDLEHATGPRLMKGGKEGIGVSDMAIDVI